MTDEINLTDDERTRCEVWTRVMGYHRPVAQFNAGKQAEFRERKLFREAAITEDRYPDIIAARKPDQPASSQTSGWIKLS